MTFTYLNRSQLDTLPDLVPMIDGIIDKGTVVMLAAQPAAGKSFLAIDWACCYATGKPWQACTVDNNLTYPNDRPATGKALYVAAEGALGMKKRVRAWEQAWDTPVPDEQLIVMPHPIQLGSPAEVGQLISDLQRTTAGLVVIDTVARCSRGLEENNAGEMGKIIDAAYRIREAMGPDGTVLLVHHHGKNGTVRGSSALLGGVDQLMTLTRDGDFLELSDEKRKDGPELPPMNLRLEEAAESLIVQSAAHETNQSNKLVDYMRSGLSNLLPISKTDLKAATPLGEAEFYACLNHGLSSGQITTTKEKNPRYQLGAEGEGLALSDAAEDSVRAAR